MLHVRVLVVSKIEKVLAMAIDDVEVIREGGNCVDGSFDIKLEVSQVKCQRSCGIF